MGSPEAERWCAEIDHMIAGLQKYPEHKHVVTRLRRMQGKIMVWDGNIQDLTSEINFLRRRYRRYIDPPDDENE